METLKDFYLLDELKNCAFCPRTCHVNRFENNKTYCQSGVLCNIASVCLHYGEEPVISGKKGICNVFFTKCNLQCIYCQNYQISNRYNNLYGENYTLDQVMNLIIPFLNDGCNMLGFVSPSHYALQVKTIVEALNEKEYYPVVVYNTNSYDNIETLKLLENIVDVYLADFKYSDANLAFELSDARSYPDVALKAIKEMYRQKGNALHLNDREEATSGIIIRHLVLPGFIDNTINVLKIIAEEISPNITLSLMSQYNPMNKKYKYDSLNRKLLNEEYNKVVKISQELGFHKGWIQQLDSSSSYIPDFKKDKPFISF